MVNITEKEQKSAEHLKRNPMGKVPVLVEGDFNLSESWAIARYIIDKHIPDNSIYPVDVKKRAVIDMHIGQLNDLRIA